MGASLREGLELGRRAFARWERAFARWERAFARWERAFARWEGAASVWLHAAVAGLAGLWLYLIPFDATDLCYLLSLEDHAWVTQEVVHPLWVPLLAAYRFVLRAFGWHGMILVPIEAANIVLTAATLILVFRMARRLTGDTLASAGAALLLAASSGFNTASMRPTPYAPAFLCMAGSLMLLVRSRQPSRLRYLAAGALGGVSMSLHASAMALAPAVVLCAALDPERGSFRDTASRVVAYGAGMASVAGACWTGWALFNGLDASFFRPAHLRTLFEGVEQVPGTSIYSSGRWWGQVSGLAGSVMRQGWPIVLPGIVAAVVEARRAWRHDPPEVPVERRLLVAAVAIFGGVAGFFLVNNNHNGFIYACVSLLPLLVARAASRGSWARRALGAVPVLAAPMAVSAALSGTHRFSDPLPAEVRWVEPALGPRSVLLVPGCAFAELRLLSQLHVFQVGIEPVRPGDCPEPRAMVGEVLHARVRSWQEQGVRVFFAYGDEARDFEGDANGREKEVQLFWRPELTAKERAPKLRAVREALASAGLRLGEPLVSPHGARYAEVTAEGRAAAPPAWAAKGELPAAATHDPQARIARSLFERFHALVPADPWAPCDALCLGIAVLPSEQQPLAARNECACPLPAGTMEPAQRNARSTCHFGPNFDQAAARAYILPWASKVGLGTPAAWGVRLEDDRAEVRLKLEAGTIWLSWSLVGACKASPVEVRSEGLPASALPSEADVRDFAEHLPAPRMEG